MTNPPPAPAPAMSEEAFQVFYQQTVRGLWRYVFVSCRNEAITDDVVQDAYIRFLRYVEPDRSFREHRAYLYRIAGTVMIRHFRGHHPETGCDRVESTAASSRDRDLVLDVQAALSDMEPRQRELLWLAHVDGFCHREIADILGVAEPSVKVMLHRARKRLKTLLEKRGRSQEVMP